MVTAMDEAIGSIVQYMKAISMYDDTMFAFISSNGGDTNQGGNNWPLRGGKHSVWNGGLKTPSFISGKVLGGKAGTRSQNMFHVTDWLPTLLDGVDTEKVRLDNTDGVSQWEGLVANKQNIRYIKSWVFNTSLEINLEMR